MTDTAVETTARTAEEMTATMSRHHGLWVSEIGEDGDLVVLGHHDPRRVIAALNRHARTQWGQTSLVSDDLIPPTRAVDQLHRSWEVLDPHRAEQHEAPWWLVPATADTPGAVPITMWRA